VLTGDMLLKLRIILIQPKPKPQVEQLCKVYEVLTGDMLLKLRIILIQPKPKPQVEQLRKVYEVLTGDMLLAAAFVSYAGPFTSRYRAGLISDWIKFLKERQMPMTEGINDPLKVRA